MHVFSLHTACYWLYYASRCSVITESDVISLCFEGERKTDRSLGAYLSFFLCGFLQSPVRCMRDVLRGLFLCDLFLEVCLFLLMS